MITDIYFQLTVIWVKNSKILQKTETPSTITYRASLLKPLFGWIGFFIQLSFPSIENTTIVVTTETNIIPEEFPYGDCTLEGCYGKLL